ncbi:uncharacterized protein DUF3105 [Motilibacter peucedani]|uniref:Uncharacterized protein DUF3105 n=1 Tax=Motilibacter peucedani TaxID=598650 RepID=A0A420XM19_9ACTN|nr:DUF3105 domain-containing protein [Motilibacter peucedani]RKS71449.1 uncharacterized protein DUF3105 [Motilibacter peucedani]
MTTQNPAGQSRKRTAEERRKAAAAARQAQLRQEARRKRLGLLAAVLLVLVLIVVIAVAVISQKKDSDNAGGAEVLPTTPTGATTTEPAVKRVTDDSGIEGVIAYNTGDYPGNGADKEGVLGHNHVDGPVKYSVTPPVGGSHNGTWMNAGVYTKPIPAERAVHNLEHGAVWITYRPGLASSEVEALKALVTKQKKLPEPASSVGSQENRFVDLSPWTDDKLPAPIVISSWGHQLYVDKASDPRLQKYIDTFRVSKKYTPEYGNSVDGAPVSIGGRAAADGGTPANPE